MTTKQPEWPEVGQQAPDFTLKDSHGKEHSLKDYQGKMVILYFYPKDNTPGCIKQACSFRDDQELLQSKNIVVLGVSPDGQESHLKFIEKQNLNFTLLCDQDHQVASLYAAYREKNLYGKKSWGIQRSTFVISPEQKILKLYKRAKADGHSQQVLTALTKMGLL